MKLLTLKFKKFAEKILILIINPNEYYSANYTADVFGSKKNSTFNII